MTAVLLWLLACGTDPDDSGGDPDRDADGHPASTDCDDRDPRIAPGEEEICDHLDNDCDGLVDEEDDDLTDGSSWFQDADGDGVGDGSTSAILCTRQDGWVGSAGDCDDSDPTVSTSSTWYADADGDGYGDPDDTSTACGAPVDHVADGTDCDDTEADVHPGLEEVCGDGLDQDCDGSADGCGPGGVLTLPAGGWTLTGASGFDEFGGAVVKIGDGLAVAAVGARTNRGQISFWSAGEEFTETVRLTGDDAGDNAGAGLATLGDTDGDGTDDLVITSTALDNGVVWLFRGPFVEAQDMAQAVARFDGLRSGFAANVAGIGDQDGDGGADLLVGVTQSGGGALAAYVFSGMSTGDVDLAGALATVRATGSGITGAGVTRLGDTDGDGVDELTIVDGAGTVTNTSQGVAYVFAGGLSGDLALTDADAQVLGQEAYGGTGMTVGAPGDVDGDGLADLLLGVPLDDAGVTDAGTAWLFPGPFAGNVSVSSATGSIAGEIAGEHVGSALGTADVNGDGTPDLLVGGVDAEVASIRRGEVLLMFGPFDGTITASEADGRLLGADGGQLAGAALGTAGDVDGDGDEELFVGAPGPTDTDDPGHVFVIPGGEGM